MDSEKALSLLALAEDAEVGLSGPESARWVENLQKRLGDLRDAAAWFLEHREPERALRLAAAITSFWRLGERVQEGREWMDSVLAGPGAEVPSAARARALYGAGVLAFSQGDRDASRSRNEEALRIARAADDWRAQLLALIGLARVALGDGDVAVVREHAQRARTLARDMRDGEGESRALHMLAAAARGEGNLAEARELHAESLALARELKDDSMVAAELLDLGNVERNLGNHERSEELLQEGLRLSLARGDARMVAQCLVALGCTAAARGDLHRAARLLGAGEARLQEAGAGPDPDDQPEFDRAVSLLRDELEAETFEELWAEGRGMADEAAVGLALRASP
jgi:non-specific serine/threonine protein kinase